MLDILYTRGREPFFDLCTGVGNVYMFYVTEMVPIYGRERGWGRG